jgi:hypothetical protein
LSVTITGIRLCPGIETSSQLPASSPLDEPPALQLLNQTAARTITHKPVFFRIDTLLSQL